jgi:hypothetical protein
MSVFNLVVYLIDGQVDEARRNIGQHRLEFQTHSHFGKQVGFSLSHGIIFISRPDRTVAASGFLHQRYIAITLNSSRPSVRKAAISKTAYSNRYKSEKLRFADRTRDQNQNPAIENRLQGPPKPNITWEGDIESSGDLL